MKAGRLAAVVFVCLTLILHVGLTTAGDAAAPTGGTQVTRDATPVQVFVRKHVKPGAVTYDYRVVNGSPFEITTLLIGFDYFAGSPQLHLAPVGWDGERVRATSVHSPAGWKFDVTQTEDDSLVNLTWEVDTLKTGLLGGTITSGFQVMLPQEDPQYTRGRWVVYLNSASQSYYVGSMDTSADTVALPSSTAARNGVKIHPSSSGGGVFIEFNSSAAGVCTIAILDAMGRSVRRMSSSSAKAGPQRTTWDGRDDAGRRLPAGVYFVQIRTPTMERLARFTLER